jgi:fermentation-respiration switch protein FrsA (DUF1100 family)
VFSRLLLWQFPLRLNIDPQQLRPIDHIATVHVPVFILNGTVDRHTPLAEAQALFREASQPKAFWAVEGAAHVDLHAYAPAEYERRVGTFLSANLRTTP